jgi:hypothetical protein
MEARLDGEARPAVLRLGIDREASADVDALDIVAPPARFAPLALAAQTGGDEEARQRRLARDVRPPGERGIAYDVELSGPEGATVLLRLTGQEHLPPGWSVRLVDTKTAQPVAFSAPNEGAYALHHKTESLRLLAGTEAFLDDEQQKLLPDGIGLRPVYPNPTADRATVAFALPEAQTVRVHVYDVLGRRVQTLATGRYPAGTHQVRWSTRGLASGVYFIRFAAGRHTDTQRAVVVR